MQVIKLGKVYRQSKGGFFGGGISDGGGNKWKAGHLSLVHDEGEETVENGPSANSGGGRPGEREGGEGGYYLLVYSNDLFASPKYRIPLAKVAGELRVGDVGFDNAAAVGRQKKTSSVSSSSRKSSSNSNAVQRHKKSGDNGSSVTAVARRLSNISSSDDGCSSSSASRNSSFGSLLLSRIGAKLSSAVATNNKSPLIQNSNNSSVAIDTPDHQAIGMTDSIVSSNDGGSIAISDTAKTTTSASSAADTVSHDDTTSAITASSSSSSSAADTTEDFGYASCTNTPKSARSVSIFSNPPPQNNDASLPTTTTKLPGSPMQMIMFPNIIAADKQQQKKWGKKKKEAESLGPAGNMICLLIEDAIEFVNWRLTLANALDEMGIQPPNNISSSDDKSNPPRFPSGPSGRKSEADTPSDDMLPSGGSMAAVRRKKAASDGAAAAAAPASSMMVSRRRKKSGTGSNKTNMTTRRRVEKSEWEMYWSECRC